MKLTIKRNKSSAKSTIGELLIDGKHFSWTLEDVVRELPGVPVAQWKIKGKTAIPAGIYKVILSMSNRFKKIMPLVVNVPGFDGIRIHNGSYAEDTDGCILVGYDKSEDMVMKSRIAFGDLMQILQATVGKNEPITLEIGY
jgi:hypothetical protein